MELKNAQKQLTLLQQQRKLLDASIINLEGYIKTVTPKEPKKPKKQATIAGQLAAAQLLKSLTK